MKLIRKLLVIFGGLFVVLLVLFTVLGVSSDGFREQHEPFVVKFTLDFSEHWQPAKVEARLSNEMLAQMHSPNVVQALTIFRSLGTLLEISDFDLLNYNFGSAGETGVFWFKGVFESGEGLVTVTIHEKDEIVRVVGFNINVTEQNDAKTPKRGA